MSGYRDYTDASLQPKEAPSEEAFILAEEKIVELLENNGWVSVKDRLPEPFFTSQQFRCSENRHLIYYSEDGEYWFIGFGWFLYDEKEDGEGGLIPYWELDQAFGVGLENEVEVTHWQPLPEPPKEQ